MALRTAMATCLGTSSVPQGASCTACSALPTRAPLPHRFLRVVACSESRNHLKGLTGTLKGMSPLGRLWLLGQAALDHWAWTTRRYERPRNSGAPACVPSQSQRLASHRARYRCCHRGHMQKVKRIPLLSVPRSWDLSTGGGCWCLQGRERTWRQQQKGRKRHHVPPHAQQVVRTHDPRVHRSQKQQLGFCGRRQPQWSGQNISQLPWHQRTQHNPLRR
jgi:hypothetical protein